MEEEMKLKIFVLALFLCLQVASAAENEYGIVKAWFNGMNATAEGIELKVGEPAEVKVEIISKIDGDVSFKLYEPGFTRAFKIIDGPSDIEKWIDISNINTTWSKTYTWTVTPSGAWKNGNAPLNIFVQFNKGMKDKKIDFSIANPYILDEQYPGSTPSRTTDAAQPTGASSEQKQAPFLSVVGVLAVMLAVWILKRKGTY